MPHPEGDRPDLVVIPPFRDPNQIELGLIFEGDVVVETPRIDYSSISPEVFPRLSGFEQEAGLRDRLKNGDLSTIGGWRPDFNMDVPLTPEQVRFAAIVREITDSDVPVRISYGPGIFAHLHRATLFGANSESSESLENKLESIRLARKAHEGEVNATFWAYSQSIGDYPAAILYRAELEADERARHEQEALVNAQTGTIAA